MVGRIDNLDGRHVWTNETSAAAKSTMSQSQSGDELSHNFKFADFYQTTQLRLILLLGRRNAQVFDYRLRGSLLG